MHNNAKYGSSELDQEVILQIVTVMFKADSFGLALI